MNRLRRTATLGAGLALALLCAAVGGTGAAAQVAATDQTFLDGRYDVGLSVDIEQVRVVDNPGRPVLVIVDQRRLLPGDGLVVWLDTDPAKPGPEYLAGGIAETDVLGLVSVHSWDDRGTWLPCPGFRLTAMGSPGGDSILLALPRYCIGNPADVRVSVMTLRSTPQGVARDFAPAERVFYPWVPRAPRLPAVQTAPALSRSWRSAPPA